jgi:Domain of unknown function (DUF4157)/Bacterial toxin 44
VSAPVRHPPVAAVTERSPRSVLRRCGGRSCPPGSCAHDDDRRQTVRRATAEPGPRAGRADVRAALASPGRPLDPATRAAMEARFGHDFSRVRVHTDAAADASAGRLGASAWTLGDELVFARDRYRPDTPSGRRLLAHELAHVVQGRGAPGGQQPAPAPEAGVEVGSADAPAEREAERAAELATTPEPVPGPAVLRRACPTAPTNIAAAPPPEPCTSRGPEAVSGGVLTFCQDSVDLTDGQDGWLAALIEEAKLSAAVELHGNASGEGPAAYNANLACWRAATIAARFRAASVTAPITLFSHGETGSYGPPVANRNVVVVTRLRSCGPDATDWFIAQVARAKADVRVLSIRTLLAGAHRLAASQGFSAEQLAIGGVALRVREAEAAAGRPPRTPTASAELAAAAPGEAELAAAGATGITDVLTGQADRPAVLGLALLRIRNAALAWADLVGTRRPYDFKNDSGTMRKPRSAHCPVDCEDTITLCPASASDCYQTDVPGNLFYAHVGRFVGWTELVLQLGSQVAQLMATRTWDPPEDPPMITLGFNLPDPLTRGGLCATLHANRSLFTMHPCANCREPTTAVFR